MAAHGSVCMCVLISAHVCAVPVNCDILSLWGRVSSWTWYSPTPFLKNELANAPHPLSSHNSGVTRVYVIMTRLTFACQGAELRSSQLRSKSPILLPSLVHDSCVSRWNDRNGVTDVGVLFCPHGRPFQKGRGWRVCLCLTEANSRRKKLEFPPQACHSSQFLSPEEKNGKVLQNRNHDLLRKMNHWRWIKSGPPMAP